MYYSHFGFDDFVIALGYKGEYIKKYMADYCSLASDLSIDLAQGVVKPHSNHKLNPDYP
jgi:glucose-1-phosphate cytidylyltransferase